MKPAACLVLVALSLALGGVLAAELVVLPGLEHDANLLDQNLAKSIAMPMHTRLLDLVVAASFVLMAFMPRVIEQRLPTVAAVGVAALASLDRLLILPALYEAWARCDLVAGRPLEEIDVAQRLATTQHIVALAMVSVLIGLAVLIGRQLVAASAIYLTPPGAESRHR